MTIIIMLGRVCGLHSWPIRVGKLDISVVDIAPRGALGPACAEGAGDESARRQSLDAEEGTAAIEEVTANTQAARAESRNEH